MMEHTITIKVKINDNRNVILKHYYHGNLSITAVVSLSITAVASIFKKSVQKIKQSLI